MGRTQDEGPAYPWGDITQQAVRLGKAVAGMAEAAQQPHGRTRGTRGGFPPGFGTFGGAFGGAGPWGRGGPWGKGPKVKRGDVRAAILSLLAEEPRNGYQVIQEINARSGGAWKPSPGAVYPALQQLADEGLILGVEDAGRRTFHLTDAGRAYVEEHPEEVRAPWEAMTAELDGDVIDLFKEAAQMGTALMQVVHAGSRAQVAEARGVIAETRRRLYGVLAENEQRRAEER
ncbi:MAG: transcriptional regulator, PadR-like family [Streptosporangiaceae bacterium]|jgi:DNA-binding PadR family transcriptional regulator|nr:transcriptional regulator, PadR-like family [Streptosporangiaceae bacterium]